MTELSTPPPIPPRRSTLSISAQIPSTYTNGSAEVDAGLTDLPDQNLNTGKFKRLTRAYAVVRRFQETGESGSSAERTSERVGPTPGEMEVASAAEQLDTLHTNNRPQESSIPKISLTAPNAATSIVTPLSPHSPAIHRPKSVRFSPPKPHADDLIALDLQLPLSRARTTIRRARRSVRSVTQNTDHSSIHSTPSYSRSPSPSRNAFLRRSVTRSRSPSVNRQMVVKSEEELWAVLWEMQREGLDVDLSVARDTNATQKAADAGGWEVQPASDDEAEEFFDADDSAWVDEDAKYGGNANTLMDRRQSLTKRNGTVRRTSTSTSFAYGGEPLRRTTTRRVSDITSLRSEVPGPSPLRRGTTRRVSETASLRPAIDESLLRRVTTRRMSEGLQRKGTLQRKLTVKFTDNSEDDMPLRRTTIVKRSTVRRNELGTVKEIIAQEEEDDIFVDADDTLWVDQWSDEEAPTSKPISRKKKRARPLARRRTTVLVPRPLYATLISRAGETISHLGHAAQAASIPLSLLTTNETAGLVATAGAVARGVGTSLVTKFGRRTTQQRVATAAEVLGKFETGRVVNAATTAITGKTYAEHKAVKLFSQGIGAAVEGGVVAGVGSLVMSGVSGHLDAVKGYVGMVGEVAGHLGNVTPLLPSGLREVAEAAGMVGSVLGGVDDESEEDGEGESEHSDDI